MRLPTFIKGVHPNGYKHFTCTKLIETLPLPDHVLISLQQHIGAPCSAVVEKGIRKKEKERLAEDQGDVFSGSGPVPIIAMTAHATKKDRQKSIDSGMDDYMSKPVRRQELLAMLTKWFSRDDDTLEEKFVPPVDEMAAQPPADKGQVDKQKPMDLPMALEEFEGDQELLVEVVDSFLDTMDKQFEMISQAVADGDSSVVIAEAHKIKGGAGNLTADSLAEAAKELEHCAKSNEMKQAAGLFKRVKTEAGRLAAFRKTSF